MADALFVRLVNTVIGSSVSTERRFSIQKPYFLFRNQKSAVGWQAAIRQSAQL
jgi:hypothetical protein